MTFGEQRTPDSVAQERIALDVHAHLAPLDREKLVHMEGVAWDAAAGALVIDGHLLGVKALHDPAALLQWMDAQRVDKAWISVPPPLYRQQLDAASARTWAEYLNAGLLDICAAHRDRMAPLYHLPLEHPDVALQLVDRWLERDAAGFALAAGGRAGPVYSDPALEPLWMRLHAADAFVFVHPGHCCDGRLAAYYLENLVGNPCETAIAAAHLVSAGVLARHSRMRVCLAHGGGATAMLAGRWQRGRETRRPGVDQGVESPPDALRRCLVDCIVHDAAALALAAQVFGDGNLLFGSDWPFPMGLPTPHRQLDDVAPALRNKLMRINPRRVMSSAARATTTDRSPPGTDTTPTGSP